MPEYPLAESIDIDARMAALAYVLDCVKRSYGADSVALRNLASLVDGVADAIASADTAAILIRGMRLLDVGEVDHVVGMLRPAPVAQ